MESKSKGIIYRVARMPYDGNVRFYRSNARHGYKEGWVYIVGRKENRVYFSARSVVR